MSGHPHDQHPLDPADHASQLVGVLDRLDSGDRVLDLGAGLGRIGRPLAEAGFAVTAVDADAGLLASDGWSGHPSVEPLVEDMLGAGATWHRRGPFDVALCLGNTLSLLVQHRQVELLLERTASCLASGGSLFVDDFPVWGWDAVHNGDWPGGLSEDGSAQMVWSPGEPCFAFRTGNDVDPSSDEPGKDERLLRLWSVSDLAHMGRRHGFAPPLHHPGPNLLQIDLL